MNADSSMFAESIDPAVLSDVVRRAERDPSFEVLEWKVSPLSHERIIETTGGLHLVNGTGRRRAADSDRDSAATPSSVVLKVINRPPGGSESDGWEDPHAWNYWRRSLTA